jgi:HD superfamily phosphodiesterase
MLEIQDILRAQEVHRWNIVATIRNQSLAEHTFNVVFIARAICKEAGLSDSDVIKCALEHDLDEIITGDIPTPTKERMKKLGFNPDDVHEREVDAPARSGEAKLIVKIADMIEASWFIDQTNFTRHGKEVRNYMWQRTKDRIEKLIYDSPAEMINNPKIGRAAQHVWSQIMDGDIKI